MYYHTFIGYKPISYVSKRTNKLIEGVNVFFTYEDTSVNGLATEECFVSNECFKDYFDVIPLGSKVVLMYNRYGQCCGYSRKEND